jgi:hypothetical protein
VETPKTVKKESNHKVNQSVIHETNTHTVFDSSLNQEFKDLQQTFKGEIESMRKVVLDQESILKSEVAKLLEQTKQTEGERNRALEEIKKLREEFMNQNQTDNAISRTVHWSKV